MLLLHKIAVIENHILWLIHHHCRHVSPWCRNIINTKNYSSATAQAFFSMFTICKRTNLIHRQTMKRLVELPLETPPSHRASPMQALNLSALFWPESSLASWIRSTLSLLWILAFSSKHHLHLHLIRQLQDRRHKQNVLRFLWHGAYHVVVRGGLHFCQSPKSGRSGVF